MSLLLYVVIAINFAYLAIGEFAISRGRDVPAKRRILRWYLAGGGLMFLLFCWSIGFTAIALVVTGLVLVPVEIATYRNRAFVRSAARVH